MNEIKEHGVIWVNKVIGLNWIKPRNKSQAETELVYNDKETNN